MAITTDLLRAHGIIETGCKDYPDMPICPKIQEAVGKVQRCDDPFCAMHRKCAFKDHPRGRARWLMLELNLSNWSA